MILNARHTQRQNATVFGETDSDFELCNKSVGNARNPVTHIFPQDSQTHSRRYSAVQY